VALVDQELGRHQSEAVRRSRDENARHQLLSFVRALSWPEVVVILEFAGSRIMCAERRFGLYQIGQKPVRREVATLFAVDVATLLAVDKDKNWTHKRQFGKAAIVGTGSSIEPG